MTERIAIDCGSGHRALDYSRTGQVTAKGMREMAARAQVDLRDADRCESLQIQPAAHQLHRRLREVTAALTAAANQIERQQRALDAAKQFQIGDEVTQAIDAELRK